MKPKEIREILAEKLMGWSKCSYWMMDSVKKYNWHGSGTRMRSPLYVSRWRPCTNTAQAMEVLKKFHKEYCNNPSSIVIEIRSEGIGGWYACIVDHDRDAVLAESYDATFERAVCEAIAQFLRERSK